MNASATHWNRWGQHLAIAGAYAACYELARYVSFSHWILTAGLRLACLLLLPVRYWPALILGETLPLIENAVLCAPRFGTPWAISASVPMVVLCMAWVKPLLRHRPMFNRNGQLRMGVLLAATLGCSLITAASTSLTMLAALLESPGKWPDMSVPTYFWIFVLGAYLGALTVTPTVLALHERIRRAPGATIETLWHSPLFRDFVLVALPLLAGLAWIATTTQDETVRQVARMAMMLPIVFVGWRHGWHGSAIVGMAASVALAATGSALRDPDMIRSQVVLALLISGALLVGARSYRAARHLTA